MRMVEKEEWTRIEEDEERDDAHISILHKHLVSSPGANPPG